MLKGRSLFPVPDGNTPYLTLEHDSDAVILEDALPFIRERETLVFRWSPETPRRGTGNRVRWGDAVIERKTVSPVKQSRLNSEPSGSGSSSSKISKVSSQVVRPSVPVAARGAAVRAAHAKRVLEEQRRLREEEQDQKETATEMKRSPPPQQSMEASPPKQAGDTPRPSDKGDECPPVGPVSSITAADLEASGSSPPPYSSPEDGLAHALKVAENKCKRTSTPERTSVHDIDPPSSPLVASPTRELHAAVAKAAMSPHDSSDGSLLVAGRSPSAEEHYEHDWDLTSADEKEKRESKSASSNVAPDEDLKARMEDHAGPSSPAAEQKAEEKAPETPRAEESDAYRTIRAVLDSLRHHPSTATLLHSPRCGQWRQRWTDLQRKVEERQYTTPTLENFRKDLKTVWSAAQHGLHSTSPEAQAAVLLDRFSQIFLAEWKGREDPRSVSSIAKAESAPDSREERRKAAAALMASWDHNKPGMGVRQKGPEKGATLPWQRSQKRSESTRSANSEDNLFSAASEGPASKKAKTSIPSSARSAARSTKPNEVDMSAFHRAMMGNDKNQGAGSAAVAVKDAERNSFLLQGQKREGVMVVVEQEPSGVVDAVPTPETEQTETVALMEEQELPSHALSIAPTETSMEAELQVADPTAVDSLVSEAPTMTGVSDVSAGEAAAGEKSDVEVGTTNDAQEACKPAQEQEIVQIEDASVEPVPSLEEPAKEEVEAHTTRKSQRQLRRRAEDVGKTAEPEQARNGAHQAEEASNDTVLAAEDDTTVRAEPTQSTDAQPSSQRKSKRRSTATSKAKDRALGARTLTRQQKAAAKQVVLVEQAAPVDQEEAENEAEQDAAEAAAVASLKEDVSIADSAPEEAEPAFEASIQKTSPVKALSAMIPTRFSSRPRVTSNGTSSVGNVSRWRGIAGAMFGILS